MFLDLPELGVAIKRIDRASLGVFATRDFKANEPLFSEGTDVVVKCTTFHESAGPARQLAPVMRGKMKGALLALLHPRAGVLLTSTEVGICSSFVVVTKC